MLTQKVVKQFPAEFEFLYEMLGLIRTFALKSGVSRKEASKIELACEEALVNIISYGYPSSERGTIWISCLSDNSPSIRLVISDDGIPYDPISAGLFFNVEQHRKREVEGGYGIYLILRIMDDVHYERREGKNVLTLMKRFA